MTLSDYMKTHNITPAAMAGALGISAQSIYKYISGERTPRPALLRKIAEATNQRVTANDFINAGGAGGAC